MHSADKFLNSSSLPRGIQFSLLKCTSHVPHTCTLKSISKFLKIYMTNFTDRSTVLHQELLPLAQQVVLLDFFQSLLLDVLLLSEGNDCGLIKLELKQKI